MAHKTDNNVTVSTAAGNDIIQAEIDRALALEGALAQQVAAIKAAQQQIDDTWQAVQAAMVAHNVKSIKGGFGSITIAERTTFKVADLAALPDQYKKLAPDTKKIGTYYALTGEAPDGTEPVVTRYLTKRLK